MAQESCHVSQDKPEAQKESLSAPETNPVFDGTDLVHRHFADGFNFLVRQPGPGRSLNQAALPQHRLHRPVHQQFGQRLRDFVQRGNGALKLFQIARALS